MPNDHGAESGPVPAQRPAARRAPGSPRPGRAPPRRSRSAPRAPHPRRLLEPERAVLDWRMARACAPRARPASARRRSEEGRPGHAVVNSSTSTTNTTPISPVFETRSPGPSLSLGTRRHCRRRGARDDVLEDREEPPAREPRPREKYCRVREPPAGRVVGRILEHRRGSRSVPFAVGQRVPPSPAEERQG